VSSSITPQYLLEGYSYALEQCGLLLRDANTLYRSGSYASTVVLAAFAREELGRSMILIGLWRNALQGRNFTIKEIRKSCDDHATKQREGMLSTVMRIESGESGLGKLLQAKMKARRVEKSECKPEANNRLEKQARPE
jgi:AbiV family abortive infection protein